MESYFCFKCKNIVTPVKDEFNHLHVGRATCFICPKCNAMVYLKEKDINDPKIREG